MAHLGGTFGEVSFGTFSALKPFYVRAPTSKDIEMCVCKLHLHGRSSVKCLLDLREKHDIKLDFDCYETFFSYLSDIPDDKSTYIKWDCTPSKNKVVITL